MSTLGMLAPKLCRVGSMLYGHFFKNDRYVAGPIGRIERVSSDGVTVKGELLGWYSTRIFHSLEEAEREAEASPPQVPGISPVVSR
jgi:hypothetical protein